MRVIISNKSHLGVGQVVINNKSKISKINFSKIAKVGAVGLKDLYDVNHSTEQDGDVLVFSSNTDSYVIETLPKVDGGTY